MQKLPQLLYHAAQVRELDRIAIHDYGISGSTLLACAGAAAFELLQTRWPHARRIAVICGLGNNAGDGFVLARLALEAGLEVKVLQVGAAGQLRGDALAAYKALIKAGGVADIFTQ
ncbi:MAG: NAD(P)H-hydrate epimerase, partial [Gammaproteobacteria bacterium]